MISGVICVLYCLDSQGTQTRDLARRVLVSLWEIESWKLQNGLKKIYEPLSFFPSFSLIHTQLFLFTSSYLIAASLDFIGTFPFSRFLDSILCSTRRFKFRLCFFSKLFQHIFFSNWSLLL